MQHRGTIITVQMECVHIQLRQRSGAEYLSVHTLSQMMKLIKKNVQGCTRLLTTCAQKQAQTNHQCCCSVCSGKSNPQTLGHVISFITSFLSGRWKVNLFVFQRNESIEVLLIKMTWLTVSTSVKEVLEVCGSKAFRCVLTQHHRIPSGGCSKFTPRSDHTMLRDNKSYRPQWTC